MRIEYFAELEGRVVRDWAHLGTQVTASGVRCVGHVPQVGRAAWLHRFYPGTSAAELDAAEQRMGITIPSAWREVLSVINGLGLFIAKLDLYGVLPGGELRRSIDDPQPFSIEDANSWERPRGTVVAADDFVVGGSVAGAASVYLLRRDGTLAQVTREGDKILGAWGSVEEMLDAEYARVMALHDHEGTYVGNA